jgi:hypothetical protein
MPAVRLLVRVADELADPGCLGGGVAVEHHPRRRLISAYLAAYQRYGRALRTGQGATRFYQRDAFEALGATTPPSTWARTSS